jgi:hypothetical protein
MAVVKPAEPRIVDLLAASGVEVSTWQLPAELYEPRFGPRIDHDDLLDFHEQMQSDAWFDELVGGLELELDDLDAELAQFELDELDS